MWNLQCQRNETGFNMDKRWIFIIAVLIIGLGSMYLIVDNSTSVGNAIASVDQVIVTIPPGFTNFQTHEDSVNVENKYTQEKLYFKSIAKGDHALEKFNKTLADWESDENVIITNESTMKINNVTAYVIYYQNTSSGEPIDYMRAYFYDYDTTFLVIMWNFENVERGNSNLKFIVENIYPDYKKPKV